MPVGFGAGLDSTYAHRAHTEITNKIDYPEGCLTSK